MAAATSAITAASPPPGDDAVLGIVRHQPAETGRLGVAGVQRRGRDVELSNFTPIPRHGYRIGVPAPGLYREAINSDAAAYGRKPAASVSRACSAGVAT
jgi:hypothetical protein